MIWIAVVLGLFLFYRYVERQHKVWIFLSLLGLVSLAAVVYGVIYGLQSFKERQTKTGITIKFVSKKPNVELGFPPEAISVLKKSDPSLFRPETKQEIEAANKVDPWMSYRRIPGEKVSEAVVAARLEKIGKDILLKRVLSGDLERLQMAIEHAEDSYTGLWKISFEVCNKKRTQLNKYWFDVAGFEKDRSTSHSISDGSNGGDSTSFTGDLIVAPNKCATFEWAPYRKFDRYEVTSVRGQWANSNGN